MVLGLQPAVIFSSEFVEWSALDHGLRSIIGALLGHGPWCLVDTAMDTAPTWK
jgi:hypothetical protein